MSALDGLPHVPMTRFRRELRKMMRLCKEGPVVVTRRGVPIMVLMSADEYAGLSALSQATKKQKPK